MPSKHPSFLRGIALLAATVTTLSLLTDPAAAQIFTARNPYLPDFTAYRIMILLGGGMAGFALGWFFSPRAKELRVALVALLGVIVVFVAVFDHGALGWSAAISGSIALFIIGLGYWTGRFVQSLIARPTTFGDAEWATVDHLAANGAIGTEGLYLGTILTSKGNEQLQYCGNRHLITPGPTRSGKGVSAIIPNLLTYEGSVLVIDPKGENAMITAEHRAAQMGQTVHVIDPWGITGLPGSHINPLDWLIDAGIDLTENAMMLADAVTVMSDKADPFWGDTSKSGMSGLSQYVATDPEEDGQRHLGRVRDLMLLDGEELIALFKRMLNSPHHLVRSTGARFLNMDPKLLSNVMASMQAQTHFLDSPRIRETFTHSDFSFDDLKRSNMTIYLVVPADRLETFGRFLRLLVQQALTINARNIEEQPDKPILFILDELAALGRLTMVEQAFGLMAGYGMQLWGFVQDLSQLKRIYGDGWETFISNAGVVQCLGPRDKLTADYFSALCGEKTVWSFSTAVARAFGQSSSVGGTSSNNSTTTTETSSAVQRKLIYPDQLMRLPSKRQLVLIENLNPVIANKAPWFEHPAFAKLGRNLHAEAKAGQLSSLN